MNEDEFIDDVLEQIFCLGLKVPHPLDVSGLLCDDEDLPDREVFIAECVDYFGLTSEIEGWGTISITVGASDEWLAVHEAGHAIVGLKMGLPLTGVRFNLDGSKGDTIFHDPDWPVPISKEFVLPLINVDVAGNMAQIVFPSCEYPEGGFLSELYNADLSPGCRCPSDFVLADDKAHRLVNGLCNGAPRTKSDPTTWPAKRAILKEAEAEAEKILRCELDSLKQLAVELRKGPMTGTAVRRIVNDGNR